MRFLSLIAAAVLLASCAGMSRMMQYPSTLADAKVWVGSREFAVWFHQSEPTVLVQRGTGGATGHALIEGATFGAVSMTEPLPIWRAAADAVLNPLGCRVGEAYTLDNSITWEARYTCADGQVVAPATVQANRATWRGGLRVPDPMRPAAAPAS